MGIADFNPGFQSEGSTREDQLLAGDHPLKSLGITIASGQGILRRGTLVASTDGGTTFVLASSTNFTDGTIPAGVLIEDIDATSAAVVTGAYFAGDFNSRAMTFGTGLTAANLRFNLQERSIYLHDAVPAQGV